MDGRVGRLDGRAVLLVQVDDVFMTNLRLGFQRERATILGPASDVPDALALARGSPRIDAAILDINLRGGDGLPRRRHAHGGGGTFVVATGYDPAAIPACFASVAHCSRPVDPGRLARALFG